MSEEHVIYNYLVLDHSRRFDDRGVRRFAQEIVGGMDIIRGATVGDRESFGALRVGWWDYVDQFPQKVNQHMASILPMRGLIQVFGRDRVREHMKVGGAVMRDMSDEEGEHRGYWLDDVIKNGFEIERSRPIVIQTGNNVSNQPVPGVQRLINDAGTLKGAPFFSLAYSTEAIAEAIAEEHHGAELYMQAFFPGREDTWAKVHVTFESKMVKEASRVGESLQRNIERYARENGIPSSNVNHITHAHVDLDFARACALVTPGPNGRLAAKDMSEIEELLPAVDAEITDLIKGHLRNFGIGSEEVFAHRHFFVPPQGLVQSHNFPKPNGMH